jgi:MFS family permease
MATSCLAIALTPSYDSIGVFAPLFFFISRALQVNPNPQNPKPKTRIQRLACAQGFSVGGELVASAIYTAESAPASLRATFGSSVFLGIIGGICMG